MKRYDNNIILAYGDLHAPYQHRHALEFLADINSDYKPDRVINLGDNLDMYSVSQFPKDVNHKDTWNDELKKGRKIIRKLGTIFPNQDIMSSNHCDRAYKKSRVAGVPREFMIPYSEVIGAPPGWKWSRDLTITVDATREQVYFAHTRTGGSVITSKDLGCTSVLGHSHTKFGMTAFSPKGKRVIYGVDAGCLISNKGAPFSYNKVNRGQPINGCVIIIEGTPRMLPL